MCQAFAWANMLLLLLSDNLKIAQEFPLRVPKFSTAFSAEIFVDLKIIAQIILGSLKQAFLEGGWFFSAGRGGSQIPVIL
jgi:hypothetical protein